MHRTGYILKFRSMEVQRKGATYAVRYGGCERMNSRDIKEYLYRVLDLLQGRGAVIASLQKDTFQMKYRKWTDC